MSELAYSNAVDLVARLRRREVSSRELLDELLDRIARLNPRINAVVTLDVERARAAAAEADTALARGDVPGALIGLPMTVKDTFEAAGMRTTAGAAMYSDWVPKTDSVAVARLRAAGANVFGKTNTPLFAGDAQTYNDVFGVTNNPWDVERSPGGSSGGSAAAVAAGLTPLELGSDIGGSIRNPAHYCGVYGHKPTHGIIPMRGHVPGPPGSLSEVDLGVAGPIARSANDLELALDVLAGPDEARGVAWQLQLPKPRRSSLREYRVAAWFDDPACPIDDELRARYQATVDALRKAGVSVDEQARPIDDLARAVGKYLRLLIPITTAGYPESQLEDLAKEADRMPLETGLARDFPRAALIRHREWLSVNEAREHYRAAFAEFFRRFDVLLCPIVPTAAIPHDPSEPAGRKILVNGAPRSYWDLLFWAGVVTMAWLPATMAPVGRTQGGLPVGVQIVGPYLEDRTPIDFARRLGDVIGGFERPPGY
jgi:amidase